MNDYVNIVVISREENNDHEFVKKAANMFRAAGIDVSDDTDVDSGWAIGELDNGTPALMQAYVSPRFIGDEVRLVFHTLEGIGIEYDVVVRND